MLNPAVFRTFGSKLAVQGRYNQKPFHRVLSRSLQGIAERPLPCNYNVIQPVSSHGGNTGSNPVGDAKPFQQLTVSLLLIYRHKKGTILGINANAFIEATVLSHRSRYFEQAQIRNTSQQTGLNQQPLWTPGEDE